MLSPASTFKLKIHRMQIAAGCPGLRPGPRWGANSAPPDHLTGFCGKEGKRKRERKEKAKGKQGKRKRSKGKRREEKGKGTKGMERKRREKKRRKGRKGKGGILCSCDFS